LGGEGATLPGFEKEGAVWQALERQALDRQTNSVVKQANVIVMVGALFSGNNKQ
jgi:hypothetical protein